MSGVLRLERRKSTRSVTFYIVLAMFVVLTFLGVGAEVFSKGCSVPVMHCRGPPG